MRRNSRPFVKREVEAQHRINDKIVAAEIRLVIEGEEPQVMSVSRGIALAEEQEMDLVEIHWIWLFRRNVGRPDHQHLHPLFQTTPVGFCRC